jgi:predicted ArsR family transcriptional regulator
MSEYGALRLINAMVIGYMVGTREVIGRGGAQAVANMAGEYAGRELVRFARQQGESLDSVEDLVAYVRQEGLANQMALQRVEGGFQVRIAQCYICPKKVGHYEFDGTACPWGGILIGALSDILGTTSSCSARLTPGETCTLHLKQKVPTC